MTTQRHQIQRQVWEIAVDDRLTGQKLHEELSRLQREVIEPLLDKCCSESSAADRVHRIHRIEVDLGELAAETWPEELAAKLEPALRKVLEAKIGEEEELAAMLGEDPAVMAQAELVSLFARTGTLPFWANSSAPRVVDAAVEHLLARDGRLLARVIRDVSREGRALVRLVRHVDPERLRALVEVLVDGARGSERASEVWEVLAMRGSSVAVRAEVLWVAALETALGREAVSEATTFIREMLGRAALGGEVTYRSLVLALFAGSKGRGVGEVLGNLAAEVQGVEGTANRDQEPGTFLEGSGSSKVPGTLEDGTTSELVPKKKDVDEKVPDEKAVDEEVPTTFVKPQPSPGVSRTGETPNSPASQAQTTRLPTPAPEQLGQEPRVRDGLEAHKVPTTFGEGGQPHAHALRHPNPTARFPQVPTTFGGGGQPHAHALRHPNPIARFPQVPTTFGKSEQPHAHAQHRETPIVPNPQVPTTFGDSSPNYTLSSTPQNPSKPSSTRFEPPPARFEPPTDPSRPSPVRFEPSSSQPRPPTAATEPPSSLLGPPLPPTHSRPDPLPTLPTAFSPGAHHFRPPASPRASALHEDPDKIYLDTSGLVLVWPFLGTFFETLDLLADRKSFRHDAARIRAIHLLQHLATTDPDPPEYRLPLAKVLCGYPYDEIALLADELTEPEISEGASLLSALLQHAPIFGDISVQQFRDAFLLRRGVLTTRDGAWLLRVERTPYDLLLQRLPWPLSWIRLPWMQAPLCVEWIR